MNLYIINAQTKKKKKTFLHTGTLEWNDKRRYTGNTEATHSIVLKTKH